MPAARGEAKLWDVERLDEPPTIRAAFWPDDPGALHRVFGARRGPYVTLSATSNAGLFQTLAPTNMAVVVHFTTQRELFRVPTGHRGHVSAFAVAPDLRRWATAADDGTAFVWDARRGVKLFALEGHAARVNAITFSPDSRRLVTASTDGFVYV